MADVIFAGLLLNFSENTLEKKFDDDYYAWYGLKGTWSFSTEEFDEEPDKGLEKMPVIRDPKDLKKALDEYNELVTGLNNPLLIPISGDDFIYNLFMGDFAVPNPIDEYLEELVDELDCKDTEAKENKLIMERTGLEDYSLELEFSEIGIVSTLTYLDSDNEVIYKITSYNTQWIPLTILGICGAVIAGIAVIAIVRVKKRR